MVRSAASASAVREAKETLAQQLRGHPDLRGIGLGRDGSDLVVQVNWRVLPEPAARIPALGEVRVVHREVGSITAQPGTEDLEDDG